MNFRPAILSLLGAALFAPASPARADGGERLEYDITWVGVSVGTMSVHSRTEGDGAVVRSIRIRNRPWIALVYPVDTTVECRIETTDDGPKYTVYKYVSENDFHQNDTLVLWPDTGLAIWSNAVQETVDTFEVPTGSRDFVSFFFDLRDVARAGTLVAAGDYQLVMDGAIHPLEITTGAARNIRTPFGRMNALPVKAASRSPTLFARNKPRSVWVAEHRPVVMFADVDTRFGAVRATLSRWEIDGEPVDLSPLPSP